MTRVLRVSHAPDHPNVDVPIPRPEQIRIEDVAHALGQIVRFGGWLHEQFSVGQHSLEVSALCEAEAIRFGVDPTVGALGGLAHDLKEAYIGDQITPAKRLLGETWTRYDDAVERSVYRGLDLTEIMAGPELGRLVDWADAEMVVSDVARWGMPGTYLSKRGTFVVGEDHTLAPPHVLRFPGARVLGWREARDAVLARWHDLRARLRL